VNPHKVYIPLIVLAVALAVLGFVSWLKSHDALRDALAQKDVLMQQKADLQERIDAAGKAELKAIADLETERKKPATVETVTKWLPYPIPGKIDVQPVNGVPTLTVSGDPAANLQAIQDMEIKCLECQTRLKSRDEQYSDLQKQLALSEQNAKNWERAAGHKTGFWAKAKDWGIRIGFAAGGYAAGRLGR